jgi:hypothetical protein
MFLVRHCLIPLLASALVQYYSGMSECANFNKTDGIDTVPTDVEEIMEDGMNAIGGAKGQHAFPNFL